MTDFNKEEYLKKVGEDIKTRRKALGLTQDELAKRAGFSSRSAIAKIEAGHSDISRKKLVSLASALCCNATDLILEPKFYKDIVVAVNNNITMIIEQLEPSSKKLIEEYAKYLLNQQKLKDKDKEACDDK